MKKRIFAMGLAALLLLCAGCGGSNAGGAASTASAGGEAEWSVGASDKGLDMAAPGAPSEDAGSGPSVYQNAGVKLIRRAQLHIQTTEFDQAAQALDQLVLDNGGYYESASVYGGSYRSSGASRSGEYVIRVPAERFDAFRASAGELGYVTNSTESSEDVGEAYYDAESRLKTQQTKHERLLTLLEQAATMEDIIDLENALSDVEYEIERLSSTLNRYDSLIGYATISLYLDEVVKVTQEVGETASLGQKLSAGFAASVEGLIGGFQNLLVWLSYHIFGVVFFAAAAVLGVTVGLRRLKKKKAALSAQTAQKKED